MAVQGRGSGLVADFVPMDARMRHEFDRQLGAFLRQFHERWHVEAVLEVLEDLSGHVGKAEVTLQRQRDGGLSVTVHCQLEPVRTARRSSPRPTTPPPARAPRQPTAQ